MKANGKSEASVSPNNEETFKRVESLKLEPQKHKRTPSFTTRLYLVLGSLIIINYDILGDEPRASGVTSRTSTQCRTFLPSRLMDFWTGNKNYRLEENVPPSGNVNFPLVQKWFLLIIYLYTDPGSLTILFCVASSCVSSKTRKTSSSPKLQVLP